jgi:hypothetical protein
MEVADITRYDTDPNAMDCVIPMPHGHLVYYTDHQLVVDHLMYIIRELQAQKPNEHK